MEQIQFRAMVLIPKNQHGQREDGKVMAHYEEMLLTLTIDDSGRTSMESDYYVPAEGEEY